MAISIELDLTDVQNLLAGFSENIREQVAQMAVNRTANKAKAEMKRQILERYNLKSGAVGAVLYTKAASRKNNKYTAELYPGTIGGKGRAMNVIHFMQGTAKGELVFQFMKSGASKVIGKKGEKSGAFIGNAGRTVFRRTGSKRLPIESVQVIDVPQMFNTRVVNQAVLDKAGKDLIDEAESALAYLLSKLNATVE